MNLESVISSIYQAVVSIANSIWAFLDTIKTLYDYYASALESTTGKSFFGFSEFLTSLAILMIAWTTTNYKFKFRISISKIPKKKIYKIACYIGAITLFFDFLTAIGVFTSLTQLIVQLGCAIVLFSSVAYWVRRAFLEPPIFNQSNCEQYKTEFFRVCDYGTDEELNAITQEMSDSVNTLVDFAFDYTKDKESKSFSKIQEQILYIFTRMGTERFCRIAAKNGFGEKLLLCIASKGKYNVGLESFADNFITEALKCDESFILNDTNPRNAHLGSSLTKIKDIYGNKDLLLRLYGLIQPDISSTRNWNIKQVKAYVTCLLTAFDTCYGERAIKFSFLKAYEILENTIKRCCSRENFDKESLELFKETISFYQKAIDTSFTQKDFFKQKYSYSDKFVEKDFIDYFVDSVVKIIYFASTARGDVQYREIIQDQLCFENIYSISNPQNDCIAFYKKLNEAILLKVRQNQDLVGIYTLFFFLERCGLQINPDLKNKYLIELHTELLSYTAQHFHEMFKNACQYAAFKMPESLSIDQNKGILYLRRNSISPKEELTFTIQ